MSLAAVPITWRTAKAWVRQIHRHLDEPAGARVSIGATASGQLVGVAMAGRPVARLDDDGATLAVTRCATLEAGAGGRNACSFLYARAAAIGRALGYRWLVTHTLIHERGASMRAAGFICVGVSEGGAWDRKKRKRGDPDEDGPKLRWEMDLSPRGWTRWLKEVER